MSNGVVEQVGPGVEVIGFTHDRASQAELVVVPAGQLTPRPAAVPREAGDRFNGHTTLVGRSTLTRSSTTGLRAITRSAGR
jgi:hypothetical protein